MATHFRVLAWRIPGTGEPSGLPSPGSHRVGHDWSDLAAAAAETHHHKVSDRAHLTSLENWILSPFIPPSPSPLCSQVYPLCLSLHCCPANRFISTIFLDSMQHGNIHYHMQNSQWEFAVWLRELKLVLCDNLEGWNGVGTGREVYEWGVICVPMADSCWCMGGTSAIL